MQRKISAVTSLRKRRLTAPNITAQLDQHYEKNVSTSTVRSLFEVDQYGRMAVKKQLFKKQNNVKSLEWASVHKDWSMICQSK